MIATVRILVVDDYESARAILGHITPLPRRDAAEEK